MWILIVLFVLLFLILLLSMPLLLEARVRVGVRGAIVHATVYVFGLIPIPLRLRIRLFSEPFFTLHFGKKQTSLLQRPKSGIKGIRKGVTIRNLRVAVTVGVTDDPARSTVYAGTLGVLLSMLLPCVAETGGVRVHAAKFATIRLAAKGKAILQPPAMAIGFWRARRIARAKAANNSVKPKEKRNEYASC